MAGVREEDLALEARAAPPLPGHDPPVYRHRPEHDPEADPSHHWHDGLAPVEVAVPKNVEAGPEQHQSDRRRGKGLVLLAAVRVEGVGRMGRRPEPDQPDHVRQAVEGGMDAVGLHAYRASEEPVAELRRGDAEVQPQDDPEDAARLTRGGVLRENSIRLTAPTHRKIK